MDDRNKLAQLGTSAESLLAPAPMKLASALMFSAWVKEPATAPLQKAAATVQELAGTAMLPTASELRFADRPPEMAAPSGAAAAAHVQDLVSQVINHVTELRQLNLNSLAVVLKPDANTEILLRLEQRGGGVEIQARFERGDFQNVNNHWEELQRSLAGQGVRLSPLENASFNSEASFHGPAGGFRQSRDDQSLPSLAREASTEPPPARRVKPQPSASGSRRWESWA